MGKQLNNYFYFTVLMSFHCEGLLSDAECKEACSRIWLNRVIIMQYCKDVVVAEKSAVLLEKYSSKEAATTLRGKTLHNCSIVTFVEPLHRSRTV